MVSEKWKVRPNHYIELLEKWDNTLLMEDIFQASLDNFIIDSGWYGEDENGQFVTRLIKDYDWENPIVRLVSYNLQDTVQNIAFCEEYYNRINK